MARKKTKVKLNFTKTRVIVFFLTTIVFTILAFSFKTPIENLVNKQANNIISYDGLVMHTIDVGQAEAIIIKLPDNKNMLIDSGNTGKVKNEILNSYLTNSYFTQTSNNKIDYFVITHSDSDHCGGAVMILENYQVNKVFRPNLFSSLVASESTIPTSYTKKYVDEGKSSSVWQKVITAMYNEPNCEIEFSHAGIEIIEQDYSIKFYAPTEDNYSNVNSYSPLIVVEYKSKKILLTGDATTKTEEKVLDTIPRCDILNVAHHGSNTSSCMSFLEKVSPKYAIISCNNKDGNNFNHPHQEVINRLLEFMPANNIYRTDLNGNIVFNISEESEINILVDVQGNIYYIKVEYILIGFIAITFVLCFSFKKLNY